MRGTRLRAGLVILCGLLLAGATRPAGLGQVDEIRIFDHPTHTRVVIQTSEETEYQVRELLNPARLYIDIDSTWIEPPQRATLAGPSGSPVRLVRSGQNTLRTGRVVLELDGRDRGHRVFHLRKPFRVVVDVYTGEPAKRRDPDPAIVADVTGFDQRPVHRVVIDPGHGGKDPGAIGPHGVREADVVLRLASELRRELASQGFEVFLTRDRDEYITLEERTAIANRVNADIFLSIHANASPDRRTQGVETYLLDTRYDRQTARVAARENGTTVGQLSELQKILASLRLGYNERFAARLAQSVQTELLRRLASESFPARNLGVKRGPFLVLFQANMPAILVEVGFVSNREEEKRLRTQAFARSAAHGIAAGVGSYRKAHGSVVAGR